MLSFLIVGRIRLLFRTFDSILSATFRYFKDLCRAEMVWHILRQSILASNEQIQWFFSFIKNDFVEFAPVIVRIDSIE